MPLKRRAIESWLIAALAVAELPVGDWVNGLFCLFSCRGAKSENFSSRWHLYSTKKELCSNQSGLSLASSKLFRCHTLIQIQLIVFTRSRTTQLTVYICVSSQYTFTDLYNNHLNIFHLKINQKVLKNFILKL